MKPLIRRICLFALLFLPGVMPERAGAEVYTSEAFSTLGDPLYDRTSGMGIEGDAATTFTPYKGWANQFTANQSGILTSIDLGITYGSLVNRDVDVRLAMDVDDFLPPPTSLVSGTV